MQMEGGAEVKTVRGRKTAAYNFKGTNPVTKGEFKASIDADALAAIIVASVDGLGIQLYFDRSIDPHRITEAFGRLLYDSLKTESP